MEFVAIVTLIPFIVAGIMFFVTDTKLAGRITLFFIWIQTALLVYALLPLFNGQEQVIGISADFFITRFDAAFILLTAAVGATALTHGYVYFEREKLSDHPPTSADVRANYAFTFIFLVAMYAVYFCKNLGYLWIAVESTTLLSAPLVYFSRTKHAIEATWKYLIICSVGISFALLGTLFIFASSQHGAAESGGTLLVNDLIRIAPNLDFKLLRFGFIFCLLGYGTKAGMFPLHSWLPDAHSEAPAPSSALLSGSLLNCALYAIWQISEIVTASKHGQLSSETTIWAGTLTAIAASFFLIRQYSLKRLFAYSSIENVGVMLFAIGLNSGALFFLQALNHSISKVCLFLLSGNIVQATGKKNLPQQTGLLASAPGWGVLMILGALAAIGAPPFGTFLSEWLILMRAFETHYYFNAVLLLLGLSLSFIVISMHIGRVILGAGNPAFQYFRPVASSAVPAILIICSLLIGLTSGPDFWSRLW
jgi:hydrogenase-4 component F